MNKNKPKPQAPVFDKSELIAKAKLLFSKPPEVVAGALHDVSEPITIEQAKDKLTAYLVRPISNEGGK